ncbi:testis-specific serine/threonine-protein kinase 2-like isoform X2 [Centruroides sculpturatus]|uniref:testis-specific serine/threonine-protein kinase 2-like isoform X2 n=1 Tax=Centruroides sculpturatus TaxID=218467 RepID=UPI000C6E12BF|nr:testis-specific serine/threonine-protein kinase 2-like isoform X2 [Centruroides sculpturatus]
MKLNSREIGIEFMEDLVKTNCFLDRGPLEIIWSEGFEVGAVIGKGAYSTVRIAEKNEVLSQLIHPNIIAIHRIMFSKNHIYIFMEFAEKGDLQDYIQRKQFLPDKKAKKYFRFLVKAMDYLHSQNISHRDLKCENLLITSNDIIKLTDFGFCRSVTDDKTGKRVLSETYCGSPGYSAPEVLQGIPYNPIMSDNWSIGVILYNMITGRLPFPESHHRKMVKYQLERHYISPLEINTNAKLECKLLINHLLEPDIIKRFNIKQVMKDPWICKKSRKPKEKYSESPIYDHKIPQ